MLTELSRLIDVQEIDKVIQEVTQGLTKLPEELKAGEGNFEYRSAVDTTLAEDIVVVGRPQLRPPTADVGDTAGGVAQDRHRLSQELEPSAFLDRVRSSTGGHSSRPVILGIIQSSKARRSPGF